MWSLCPSGTVANKLGMEKMMATIKQILWQSITHVFGDFGTTELIMMFENAIN
jgi:hypothetical protein